MTAAGAQRDLGRGGLRVSTFGFGAAQIANLYREVDEDAAQATVQAAWDAGVRYFDTAPHYGLGLSERRLGAALVGKPRTDYVLSSKVGRLLVPRDPAGEVDDEGFVVPRSFSRVRDYSADGVLRSIEASLDRLGVDRLDIVYVHDPDDYAREALEGAFPALDRLRGEGVITSYGAGMNQSALLARFVRETDLDVVMLANRYTLLEQRPLDDLLAITEDRGVSVVAAAVFNSGLLATRTPRPGAHYDYASADGEVLDRAQHLARICEDHGVPLPAAAAQFALGHPSVSSICLGTRTAEQARANAALFDIPIPALLWADLRAAGLLRSDAPVPLGMP